jgi:hypothetical protein
MKSDDEDEGFCAVRSNDDDRALGFLYGISFRLLIKKIGQSIINGFYMFIYFRFITWFCMFMFMLIY